MINCGQCLHYLVCKHTDKAEEAMKRINELPSDDSTIQTKVICIHEKHSDEIIASPR